MSHAPWALMLLPVISVTLSAATLYGDSVAASAIFSARFSDIRPIFSTPSSLSSRYIRAMRPSSRVVL